MFRLHGTLFLIVGFGLLILPVDTLLKYDRRAGKFIYEKYSEEDTSLRLRKAKWF